MRMRPIRNNVFAFKESNMSRSAFVSILAILLTTAGLPVAADELPTFTLTLKNNRFDQELLEVPSARKMVLVIKNLDSTAEEFESKDLKLEKIVPAGKEIRLNVGPLKPGQYKFVGEYHEKTAHGVLVAK